MWVFRSSDKEKQPLVWFNYQPTRHSKPALEFLQNYEGSIVTDGYAGYIQTGNLEKINHAGCWAHARRKFTEAKKSGKEAQADVFISLINKLYHIENKSKNLSDSDLIKMRQKKSKPILDKIKILLLQYKEKVLPKSLFFKAITYTLNQWDKLIVFLEFAKIPIDNNPAENAIRPFVIGRKNWLFSGSPKGASASALFYSLIETAKANNIEPFWYLYYLLETIMYIDTNDKEALEKIMPYNITQEEINKFRNGIN
jgi:transposase